MSERAAGRDPGREGSPSPPSGRRRALWMLALALVTSVLFAETLANEFVSFDDPAYVTENPRVRAGLTAESVAWAFRGTAGANWHPATWLSHMLDVELFGMEPGAHHRTSVLLHAASAALLFLFLARATGRDGLALFAAAFFAVHPLRVESVAWIAERKDVLAGFFWMASLVAYERFARAEAGAPGRRWRLAAGAAFLLALLAKPMAVTLPLVLLICDAWPLGRRPATPWRALVVEKVPWLVLSLVVGLVTLVVQGEAGAVRTTEHLPLLVRAANAALSVWTYLLQTVWPVGLSFHYPHPYLLAPGAGSGLLLRGAAGLVGLGLVTLLAWRVRRRQPHVAFGWAWYGVTLLPVVGLVQVGIQGHADRYTYLTTIGPVVAAVWGAGAWARRSAVALHGLRAAGIGALLLLGILTIEQVGTWRNSHTLYEQALDVEPRNTTALVNLGSVLLDEGQLEAAIHRFRQALDVRPDHVLAGRNLGVALAREGRYDEACEVLEATLERAPGDGETRAALGNVLARAGRFERARVELEAALAARPGDPQVLFDLAGVHAATGELERAARRLDQLLELHPEHAAGRELLGRVRERLGSGAGSGNPGGGEPHPPDR